MKIARETLITYHPIWCFIHITHTPRPKFYITHDLSFEWREVSARKKRIISLFFRMEDLCSNSIFWVEDKQANSSDWCIVINSRFALYVPFTHQPPQDDFMVLIKQMALTQQKRLIFGAELRDGFTSLPSSSPAYDLKINFLKIQNVTFDSSRYIWNLHNNNFWWKALNYANFFASILGGNRRESSFECAPQHISSLCWRYCTSRVAPNRFECIRYFLCVYHMCVDFIDTYTKKELSHILLHMRCFTLLERRMSHIHSRFQRPLTTPGIEFSQI